MTIWTRAKRLVCRYEHAGDAVLIADDTIMERAHTDENALVSWHFDPSKGRTVKGVNLLSLLFDAAGGSVPVNAHLAEKTEGHADQNTGQTKYRSRLTKNQITRRKKGDYPLAFLAT